MKARDNPERIDVACPHCASKAKELIDRTDFDKPDPSGWTKHGRAKYVYLCIDCGVRYEIIRESLPDL